MNITRSSVAVILAAGVVAACSSARPGAGESAGSSAQALASATVFHSTQNGGDASGFVSHYDADSQSYYSLQFDAWENRSAQSRTASLSFYGYGATTQQVCFDEPVCSSWDYSTWTCSSWEAIQYCYETQIPYWIYGYGNIPTNDFRIGAHTAHLTTDLANDLGFTATRCGWDANWSYSCTPVTGTLDVTWRDNGNFNTEQQGTWSSTSTSPWGTFSTRSTGHASTSSADVSGTVLGDAPSTWGKIGQSKDTSVTRDLVQGTTPPPPPDGGVLPPPPGDGG